MEEAARLCDRLVIMEGGLIIAEGSPKELIAEHVSPQVLEFRAAPQELERLRPVVEDVADAVERTGEALVAYTADADALMEDRKSTRLNSSHANISYAVFCLKKKKQENKTLV